MNQDSSNLLSQLRDIHAAADPGWWPPAPGWWLLAVLLAAVTALTLRHGYRKWSVMRRRRKLLAALADIARNIDPVQHPHEYLSRLNRLFRVVAVRAFPGTGCVRLQGIEWVRFIQSLLPKRMRAESLTALASGPYQSVPEFDVHGLQELARTWVRKYG